MESNKVDRTLNLASVHGKIFHMKQRILIVQPNQFCLSARPQCQFSPNERELSQKTISLDKILNCWAKFEEDLNILEANRHLSQTL